MNTLKPTLDFSGKQSPAQSLLISIGLIYLAIPNILFLWGWFEPAVALTVSALIVWAVGRAIALSFKETERLTLPSLRAWPILIFGLLFATLVSFYFLFKSGLLGILPTHCDLNALRNAMFANLRDAAWPLILPNGKEMSYYLANVLPPAMLARLVPESGQWAIIIWSLVAMLLEIALVSTLLPRRWSFGWRLMAATLFLTIFFFPSLTLSVIHKLTVFNEYLTGYDHNLLRPGLSATHEYGVHIEYGHPLSECGAVYNSYPPALLVAAILATCRIRAEVVLPVALALLVPLSPFGGLGLMPLVLLRWWMCINQQDNFRLSALLPDTLLPVAMAFLCAIYFTRADGSSAITLTCFAWGWKDFLLYEARLIPCWLTVILPLWFVVKRDAFFLVFVACCFLMPFVFIGTVSPTECRNNELLLKSSQPYALLAAVYWLVAWRSIGWYKYALSGICFILLVGRINKMCHYMGTRAYMEASDNWNGHLNHSHPFLNQSVPYCKNPLIPGIMLREGGESERHFPGKLLPKAPGCDYSRPATPQPASGTIY